MALYELRLLGSPMLVRDGVSVDLERRGALALLAYLAMQTDSAHTCLRRDNLAVHFWPDADAKHARSSLRRTLAVLTKTFAGTLLTADRDNICLSRAHAGNQLRVDVDLFHSLLAQCRHNGGLAESICEPCLLPLTEAAALYRGDFMSGFSLPGSPDYDDWQRNQSDALRCALAGVLSKLVVALMERHCYQPAIGYAQRWLALDTLHEPAQRSLMQLYALVGQPLMALRQFHGCAGLLARELNARPQAETIALFEAIRAGHVPAPAIPSVQGGEITAARPPMTHAAQNQLVGRERELASVLAEWERVCAGDVRVLLVEGEPGIGKTRLVLEFLARTAGNRRRTAVAHCDAEGMTPFSPFAEWMRTGLHDAQSAAWLATLSPTTLTDLLILAPDFHTALSPAPASPAMHRVAEPAGLFGSAYACLCAMAGDSTLPLLLLLDDIQWADIGTLRLLRYILQRAQESRHRLLLVLTLAGDNINLIVSKVLSEFLLTCRRAGIITSVPLGRLSREQVDEMIGNLLNNSATSPRGISAIHEWSEGNPFFIAEICKSLSGQSLLDQGAGLKIPPNVCSAVMARVARLPEATRKLLFMAAMTEGGFRPDLIQQACTMADDAFVAALECAVAAQLIHEMANAAIPQYAFAHAQIPVILSESMSTARVRLYERRIALAAAALYMDDVKLRVSQRTAG